TENAEVVRVVRVFPDVLAGEDQILSERLLEPRVKFVAPTGAERNRVPCRATQERIQHRAFAADAGKNKILIERSFQHPSVRDTQNRIARLDVVSNSETRLCFTVVYESPIEITAQTQVQ